MGAPVPPQGRGTEGKSRRREFTEHLTKQRGFVVRNEPSHGNTQRSCSRNLALASRMLFLAAASETWSAPPPPPPPVTTGSLEAARVSEDSGHLWER